MVCPCCGKARAADGRVCGACGARSVAEPLVAPEVILPRLGAALTALGCALLVFAVFAGVWLLGNDFKVARVLLVWALGSSTELTRSLLAADPNLPYYRIFSYDAYRLAFFLSFGLIPLSLLGVWLARRAARLARREPARFGGWRLARASLALSLLLFLAFSAAAVSSIPRAIEQGRAKHRAATYAIMYQYDLALRKYYREYGTYPEPSELLAELQQVSDEPLPPLDYWQSSLAYTTASLIASKDGPPGFSNYQLVSPGPDAILGTADDLIMRDGMIVSSQEEADLPASLLAPEKPVK